ncbi:hypothetical protein RhiirA4_456912 [Rhizophagus irregularis]|uniref:Uncharacterized protein n=1 Tax=Rhizophagus irregularis TaxID=588596 RepID=A0A2I1G8T1_9GLOM|nr:hypothetical protein RhiirA4_456912 [Rhizophagus irregularis]
MEDSNDYNKDIYKTNAFFSPYSETLDFLLSPFNDSFSLETSSKPSINPSLELLSEPSLELSPKPSSKPSSKPSFDTFIHQYCLERGFGYQVY